MVLKSGLLSPLNLCAVFLKVKVNYSVEETSLRPSRVTTAPARYPLISKPAVRLETIILLF